MYTYTNSYTVHIAYREKALLWAKFHDAMLRYYVSIHAVRHQIFLTFSGYIRPTQRASYTCHLLRAELAQVLPGRPAFVAAVRS